MSDGFEAGSMPNILLYGTFFLITTCARLAWYCLSNLLVSSQTNPTRLVDGKRAKLRREISFSLQFRGSHSSCPQDPTASPVLFCIV